MKFSSDKMTHDLVIKKLESSGLTSDDGAQLGMKGLLATETIACCTTFQPVRSLKIPYYDPAGSEESDWQNCPPFYRLRYLEDTPGFSQLTQKYRYVQPPNTLPVVYYPKLYDGWVELCQDPDQPLIITEGELKAAKACKEGFPTIALGGVWSFRSAQHGVSWLKSLEYIEWTRRNTYICFDSDLHINKNVQSAIREITNILLDLGAYTHLLMLPNPHDQKKTGIDDFFVLHGRPANKMFRDLVHAAEPYNAARQLFAINQERIYVENPGVVINLKTRAKMSPNAFREHGDVKRRYLQQQLNPNGTVLTTTVQASKIWLEWPLRHDADCMTYKPGEDPEFTEHNISYYNLWNGWGCEPKKGDVHLFLELVDHIFDGVEKGGKEWFLKWCAWPIKYPGTKLFSSVVIHGVKHGTGKTLIGYTLGKIYGKNYTEIKQGDLHGNFNEWAEGKQFVMGDDVTGSDKRQDNDMLKKLITQNELRVNAKYVPSYVVPDCINYYFTSNHPNAFFLEDDDRRFFIHEVTVRPLPEDFYMDYGAWIDGLLGAPAVFHYLLNLDTDDFNPAAPAFKTAAKNRMIVSNQSDLGSWCRALVDNPNAILKIGDTILQRDLWTSKELLHFYDPEGRTRVTANGLSRELSLVPVPQVCNGMQIRLKNGTKARYFPVRNIDKWIKTKENLIAKHIEETTLLASPKPPKY